MKNLGKILIFISLSTLLFSCKEKYTPKPRGYYRIDFPEKHYQNIPRDLPYNFEVPVYSVLQDDRHTINQPNEINIAIPENKAEIHISYFELNTPKSKKTNYLAEIMEETRELAYKHTMKADAIEEQIFINPAEKVYGTIYKIRGNAASPLQFFLTDSLNHFLRGALYIREVPNIDSLQPVITFMEPDVVRLIETCTWK